MNNKYDTKGMAALVEKLDKISYLSKVAMKEIRAIDKLTFSPEDELKHLDLFVDDSEEELDYTKI